jgi:hypothetical protein
VFFPLFLLTLKDMLIVFVAMIFVAIITTITTAIVNAEAVRVASLKVTFFFVLAKGYLFLCPRRPCGNQTL